MTRGVLMYAHNNTEIDYFKIACANALLVQKNLKVPVTLVSDEGTVSWGKEALGEDFVNQCFEQIVIVERDYTYANPRNYSDTSFSSRPLQFYNCKHWQAYKLSPYDETLFIDSDYLIMSSALNNCWGSNKDIMINKTIINIVDTKDSYTKTIDDFGITQYWATVVYFTKSSFSELFFNIVEHIENNYSYFNQLFYFTNRMFRNDNAFSIAVHMLNGFIDSSEVISELPIPGLFMSWDRDDILDINGLNDITIYAEKSTKGTYTLTRLKNQDVHVMNKWAINRFSDKLIDLYKEIK